MSFDETITTTIKFDMEGIDRSIGKTQRYLYFMNAVRLSIVDLQQLAESPSIGKLLWTTIQLTRAWTHFHRILKMANKEQDIAIGKGLLRGAVAGRGIGMGARGLAAGQQTLFGAAPAATGLLTRLGALMFTLDPTLAAAMYAGLIVGGVAILDYRQQRIRQEWLKKQREIAKSQGLEN